MEDVSVLGSASQAHKRYSAPRARKYMKALDPEPYQLFQKTLAESFPSPSGDPATKVCLISLCTAHKDGDHATQGAPRSTLASWNIGILNHRARYYEGFNIPLAVRPRMTAEHMPATKEVSSVNEAEKQETKDAPTPTHPHHLSTWKFPISLWPFPSGSKLP